MQDGKHMKSKHHASKMHKKGSKLKKLVGKVSGGKSTGRLDKKARGANRPNPDGMSAESPMSKASKSKK